MASGLTILGKPSPLAAGWLPVHATLAITKTPWDVFPDGVPGVTFLKAVTGKLRREVEDRKGHEKEAQNDFAHLRGLGVHLLSEIHPP